MSALITGRRPEAARQRAGRPPLPREHGAWVILYAPLAITFAAYPPPGWGPALLMMMAVTGLFLARNVLGLLLRGHGRRGMGLWLAAYLALAAAGALPLLLAYGRLELLTVGLLAASLFGVHALLSLEPARRRLDQSQWGETLAVGALALTAPAAYAVARGGLDPVAWCLWAACALYFGGGVFFVRMLLNAAKVRGEFGTRQRWRAGRDNVLYHGLLTAAVAGVALHLGGRAGLLALLAYLPAVFRAFRGWLRLSNRRRPSSASASARRCTRCGSPAASWPRSGLAIDIAPSGHRLAAGHNPPFRGGRCVLPSVIMTKNPTPWKTCSS